MGSTSETGLDNFELQKLDFHMNSYENSQRFEVILPINSIQLQGPQGRIKWVKSYHMQTERTHTSES